jgi:hypothetical protein
VLAASTVDFIPQIVVVYLAIYDLMQQTVSGAAQSLDKAHLAPTANKVDLVVELVPLVPLVWLVAAASPRRAIAQKDFI